MEQPTVTKMQPRMPQAAARPGASKPQFRPASARPKPVTTMETSVIKPMFTSVKVVENQYKFTLTPIHVSYANTLRRIILTGIQTVAFRSDMVSTGARAGTTTDVAVLHNDTPMTNEMLADRIGLLPITYATPRTYNKDDYAFVLNVKGSTDKTTYVHASDFKITQTSAATNAANAAANAAVDEKDDESQPVVREIANTEFFKPFNLTGDTSLIAILTPSTPEQRIHIEAKASVGTGREHARFSPVSQCSYEYSLDDNQDRIEEMFTSWLNVTKKISSVEKGSARHQQLEREFQTMQIKRCYLINEKQEPYSFDFTVESVGTLPVEYIVGQACEVAENMCIEFVNMDKKGSVPKQVTISPSDSRIIGFDFLIRGHDHTLGNLLQTWLVENHIEGSAQPRITYAGYSVPHPLRDEIILRIGLQGDEDDLELVAKQAIAAAARGCATMFHDLGVDWKNITGADQRVPRPASGRPLARGSMKARPKPEMTGPITVTKSDA